MLCRCRYFVGTGLGLGVAAGVGLMGALFTRERENMKAFAWHLLVEMYHAYIRGHAFV